MSEVDPVISYSVKEVLGRIEQKIDQLVTGLASKADHSSIVALHERVDQTNANVTLVGDRVTEIEHWRKAQAEHTTNKVQWRQWIIPTVISLIGTVALLLSVFHP